MKERVRDYVVRWSSIYIYIYIYKYKYIYFLRLSKESIESGLSNKVSLLRIYVHIIIYILSNVTKVRREAL